MRCQEIQVLLAARGELSVQEERQVHAHLRGCTACREVATRIEHARKALRALPAPLARVPKRVGVAIDALVTSTERPSLRRARLVLAGAVLAALLLGLFLERGRFLGAPEPGNTVATPVPTTPTPVTIRFSAPEVNLKGFQRLVDRFQKTHPHIQVEFVKQGRSFTHRWPSWGGENRGYTEVADVISWEGAGINNAYVHDLRPLIASDPTFAPEEFLPGLLDALDEDGAIYKLPRSIRPRLLSYNKQRLAQSGLALTPVNDWTWSELLDAAQALAHKEGDTIQVYGLIDRGNGADLMAEELAAAGVDLRAFAAGDIPLTSPELEVALERIYEHARQGTIYIPRIKEWMPMPSELVHNGLVGFWDSMSTDTLGEQQSYEEGLLAYPNTVNEAFSTQALYLSASSQHVEAAWAWMSFLSRQPLASTIYDIPARATREQLQAYWAQVGPERAAASQTMLARLGPDTVLDEKLYQNSLAWQGLRRAYDGVTFYRQTPKTALETAQRWIDEERQAQAQAQSPTPSADTSPTSTPSADTSPTSTPSADTSPAPTPTAPASTQPPSLPTTTPGGKVIITFALAVGDQAHYQPLLDRFNQENSDLHAQFASLSNFFGINPDADRYELASLADVLLANGVDLDPRHLHDLRPFMQADPSFDPGAYLPGLFDAVTNPDGTIYKLPSSLKSDVILYNKQLWAEAGLPAPSNDWTWADFTAAAQAMSRTSGATITTYGFLDWGSPWDLVQQELEQEGIDTDPLHQDLGDVDLTRPEFEQALRHIAAHRTSGTFKSALLSELSFDVDGEEERLVSEGKVGMWRADYIPSGAMPSFKIGVLARPRGWDGGLVTTSYAISRATVDAEAAWRLISFLSRQPLEAQNNYDQPALADQALQEHFWSLVREARPKSLGVEHEAAMRVQLDRLGPNTRVDQDRFWFKLPQSILLTALERVFLWHEDAATALATAQRSLETYQSMPTPRILPLVRATPAPSADGR